MNVHRPSPKYHSFREAIRNQIVRGTWKPGDRLPTERTMASDNNLSRATIRSALSELVREGVLSRHQGRGTFVNRMPAGEDDSPMAVHWVCGYRRGRPEKPYIAELFDQDAGPGAREMIVTGIPSDSSLEEYLTTRGIPESFKNGVVISGYVPSDAEITLLKSREIPCILVGRPEGKERIAHIEGDHVAGARMAVEHLVQHGHTSIALLDGPEDFAPGRDRIAGFRLAMDAAGLPVDAELIIPTIGWEREAGRAAAEQLLAGGAGATALISYGDWSTFGVMSVLAERGMRVPEDIAVVMVDHYPWIEKALSLGMTAVEESYEELAQTARELLAAQLKGHILESIGTRLMPSLVIRESCGCKGPDSIPPRGNRKRTKRAARTR